MLCAICGEDEATTLVTLGHNLAWVHGECAENQREMFKLFPSIVMEVT